MDWIMALGVPLLIALPILLLHIEKHPIRLCKPKPKMLKVGDKMPPDDGRKGNMGGMISVCPSCDRIDAIFHP